LVTRRPLLAADADDDRRLSCVCLLRARSSRVQAWGWARVQEMDVGVVLLFVCGEGMREERARGRGG
jgi:hypothetical protein